MSVLLALAGCVGEAGLICANVILLRLSRKLGVVTKSKPYYRGYYISIIVLSAALLARIGSVSMLASPADNLPFWFQDPWGMQLLHHALLALGLTMALPITYKYWGWLFRE